MPLGQVGRPCLAGAAGGDALTCCRAPPPPPMPLPSGVSPPRSWSLCVTLCAPQCPSLSGRSFGTSVSTCPSLQGPVGQGGASHRTGLSSQWHGFGVGEQATSWLPCLARGWQAQGLVLGVPGLLYYALRGGRVSSGACAHVLVESGTCVLQPEGPRGPVSSPSSSHLFLDALANSFLSWRGHTGFRFLAEVRVPARPSALPSCFEPAAPWAEFSAGS